MAGRTLLLLLVIFINVSYTSALKPLTQIKASQEELDAFKETLKYGMSRALGKRSETQPTVVHVIGATDVEDAVDFTSFCNDNVRILLTGPQVEPLAKLVGDAIVPRDGKGQECVYVLRGLYSSEAITQILGTTHPVSNPDMLMVFNGDVYASYWRRTLASMLRLQIPVVVTMYCEFEGKLLTDVLEGDDSFNEDSIAACDNYIKEKYRGDANDFIVPVVEMVPYPHFLWTFEQNAYAHTFPRNCLVQPYTHGVRNSYWLAFKGGDRLRGRGLRGEKASRASSADPTSPAKAEL